MRNVNRILNMGLAKKKEPEVEFRAVLYHIHDSEGVMFTSQGKYEEALKSGEWVRRPSEVEQKAEEVDEDLLSAGHSEGLSEDLPEEDDTNWAERMRLRKPELPPVKKRDMQQYLSQMNVKNLIKEGAKWGLDFSNYYDLPVGERSNKLDMRQQIKMAMWKQAGIPLR